MFTYNAFRIYKYQLAGQAAASFLVNHDYEETTKHLLRHEHEEIKKYYLLDYQLVFFVDIDEDDSQDFADMLEAAVDKLYDEIYPMQVSGKLWYGDEAKMIEAICRFLDHPLIESAEIWGRDSWKRVAEIYR